MTTRAERPRRERDLVSPVVAAAATTLVLSTIASSYPHAGFDRLRKLDPTNVVLPDWRFFAPSPARHDFHVLFRVSRAPQEPTPWEEVQSIAPRRWSHGVWFPGRRREKALFDHVLGLVRLAHDVETRILAETVPYQVLLALVAQRVRTIAHPGQEPPDRFQFAVVRYSGVDDSEDVEFIMVSPWQPVREPAARNGRP